MISGHVLEVLVLSWLQCNKHNDNAQFVSDMWIKTAAVDVLLQIWNVLGLCRSLKMSFKREVSPESL
jgi:hypothetical protein